MFGMFGTDDPRKMALQSVGMQMLMGGDPNQALQNLPQMLMEAKKLQYAREQDAKSMALQETQLGLEKERFNLLKSQDLRAAQDREGKMQAGKAFSDSLMNPNGFTGTPIGSMAPGPGSQIPMGAPQGPPAGMSSMMPPQKMAGGPAPQVTTDFKGDIAVPLGEENNPITQGLQNLPRGLKGALQADPGMAAELMAPAMQQSLTDAIAPKGDRVQANVINLRHKDGTTRAYNISNPTQLWQAENAMADGATEVAAESGGGSDFKPVTLTNGQEIKSFNVETPEGAAAADKAMSEGWYEAPDKTIVDKGEDPNAKFNQPYDDYIISAQKESMKSAESRDDAVQMGSLVMNSNTYAGPGAPLYNALLQAGQSWFGAFDETDLSGTLMSDKMKKRIVLKSREMFAKDSQMSNGDRKYLDDQIPDSSDGRQVLSRFMALKTLEAEWSRQKTEFLEERLDKDMKPKDAVKEWGKYHRAEFRKFFSEENQQAVMEEFKKGSQNPTLIEETLGRINRGEPAAAPAAEQAPVAQDTPTPIVGQDPKTGMELIQNIVSPQDGPTMPVVRSPEQKLKVKEGSIYYDMLDRQYHIRGVRE